MTIHDRKLQHIDIVLEKKVEPITGVFDSYQLPFKSLPEIDMDTINMSMHFLGKKISMPLIIGSMTGGPEKGKTINTHLALAAEHMKIPLALGSMRIILRDPGAIDSFNVRKLCPSVPLLANMGIVQLNYGYDANHINKIVDSIQADGIFLHINPLQEAIQPEGDRNRSNLIPKLKEVIPYVKVPIIIKEVGNGIDASTAQALINTGIQRIDVNGLGGTSRPWVEGYRRGDHLGKLFSCVGYTTPQSLQQCRQIPKAKLIAGGGIRSGIDVVKSLIMGAQCASIAKPLLKPALASSDAVIESLTYRYKEIQIAMFACGAQSLQDLSTLSLHQS